jgi:hypothetical protein
LVKVVIEMWWYVLAFILGQLTTLFYLSLFMVDN